jgi:hypothetical protein
MQGDNEFSSNLKSAKFRQSISVVNESSSASCQLQGGQSCSYINDGENYNTNESNESNAFTGDAAERQQEQHLAGQNEKRFQAIRDQNAVIEESINMGEEEVIARDELAFYMQQHAMALANMQEAHVS